MVRVEVDGVRVQRAQAGMDRGYLEPEDRTYLTLREAEGRRALDMEIGHSEAFAISSALEGTKWKRPMTHKLLGQVVVALGATLRKMTISEHRDGVYVAEMELVDRSGDVVVVSARPSDAVAVALQVGAPILVSEALLADVA